MIVQVYYNLHRKCWSVRDKKTRRVIDHREEVFLKNCLFRVSQPGRERVLASGQKNVHAYVEGELIPLPVCASPIGGLYYNPYKQATFTCNGQPVYQADAVLFTKNKTAYLV